MRAKRIFDYLPEYYEPILPRFFNRSVPSEDLATCETCAMCRREGEPRLPDIYYYRPDSKCCTFYPSLPNYAIGALLLDHTASLDEGRRRVRRLIAGGIGAIPQGLTSLPEYDVQYQKLSDRYFGKMTSLRCPYYDRGKNACTIWPFRNAVCVTYFCMSVRGLFGIAFWKSVRLYLSRLEEVLSAHALHAMGWPPDLILETSISAGRQGRDPAFQQMGYEKHKAAFRESLWADHKNNKEKVYIEAYKHVSRLRPKDVNKLGGALSRISLEQVRQAYKKMRGTAIPDRLKKNDAMQVIKRGDEVYLLLPNQTVYSLCQTIFLALTHFDGKRPAEEAVRLVKREYGLTLTKSFLLALIRRTILVPIAQNTDP